jgi:hypothetical protein
LEIGWPAAVLYAACIKRGISLCKVKGGVEQRIAALEKPMRKYLVCSINGPKISHFFGVDKDRNLVFEGNLKTPLVFSVDTLRYCTWGNLRSISHVYKIKLKIDLKSFSETAENKTTTVQL